MGLHEVLVFAAPFKAVAFRNLEGGDFLLRLVHITAHVTARKIDIDVRGEKAFFTLYARGTPYELDIGKLCEGNSRRGARRGLTAGGPSCLKRPLQPVERPSAARE